MKSSRLRKAKTLPKAPRKSARKSSKKRPKKGFFLTFEGGEGVGKTTQIRWLAEALTAAGREVVITREPGGSPIADQIRALVLDPNLKGLASLPELLLYEASRAQHVHDTIKPALARGCVVICDRFADSSVVYQGAARGLDAKLVRLLNRIATEGLEPDLTFVLDLDPKIGLARAGKRGSLDRIESETLQFHQQVRAGYRKLVRTEKKRVRLIPADRSLEEVRKAIAVELKDLLRGSL